MTEAEAREIVERYEALVTAITSGSPMFDCPLEISGGKVFANQTERIDRDGLPIFRVRDLNSLSLTEVDLIDRPSQSRCQIRHRMPETF